ncbi:6-phosphogluconolactonase [Vulcaniibacterium tengchongense]|uniref:6-phosphogluconolactonase n=1 Tax=Vulcaniibacterium tengchongense TaxID=1273429 RepID=A0A3N4VQL4_9GAMM|nr:6-phosphogluconolactonase [Vulcaniibacterium tengchongense]RPE81491.1 6-phosphogluconolactonase [Vulcaniibacterium tengchongense]
MPHDSVPPAASRPASARHVLHAHPNAEVWTWASAVAIAAELRRSLSQRPRVRLLVSGGETPAPVYRALAKAPLDWPRIDVALVDERWLHPDDADSNARLVRDTLLQDHAAQARFEPLTRAGRPIEEAVAAANAHAHEPASVAVLGMGEDGHTASLFPGMRELERTLQSRQAYVAVDAAGCPGARGWPRRISLTPAGLARAACRMLLLRGLRKREVFEAALADGDALRWPVLVALGGGGTAPLQVHWCR